MADFTAHCSRCGRSIKNVVVLDGKPVGTTCAASILGIPVGGLIITGGVVNTAKMQGRDEYLVARDAMNEKVSDVMMAARAQEKVLVVAFWVQLDLNGNEYDSEFWGAVCEDMKQGRMPSDRGIDVFISMFCKLFGRSNSKANEAKYDFACGLIDPICEKIEEIRTVEKAAVKKIKDEFYD